MTHCKIAMAVALALTTVSLSQAESQSDCPKPNCRIYIGDMGPSEHAARFKMVLRDELEIAGVVLAKSEDSAEAILTGVFTHESTYVEYDKPPTAISNQKGATSHTYNVTLRLDGSYGEKLWLKDFVGNPAVSKKELKAIKYDMVRARAKEAARAIALHINSPRMSADPR